jgi:hypothetical protein
MRYPASPDILFPVFGLAKISTVSGESLDETKICDSAVLHPALLLESREPVACTGS